jgi:hypothetical protein
MGIIPNPNLRPSSQNQQVPTRYDQLTVLDYLINTCDSVRSDPASPRVWALGVHTNTIKGKSIPAILNTDFCLQAPRLLANINTPTASAALLAFRKIDFWLPNRCFNFVDSRPASPTRQTQRKYARLLLKLGNSLAKVRDNDFLRQPPVDVPIRSPKREKGTRKKKGFSIDRETKPSPYSTADDARYKRTVRDHGADVFSLNTNSEIIKKIRPSERTFLNRKISPRALRQSLCRIRARWDFPPSKSFHKKK